MIGMSTLADLGWLRPGVKRKRASSYDPKGGNSDWWEARRVAWATPNLAREINSVILEAVGNGHYVSCHLDIDCFTRQANDWYTREVGCFPRRWHIHTNGMPSGVTSPTSLRILSKLGSIAPCTPEIVTSCCSHF